MSPRPSDFPDWATTGTRTTPSAGQILTGWLAGTAPPASVMNYLQGVVSDWLRYFDTEKLPSVEQTNSATPVFGTNSRATDHPSSASNKWKLWGQMKNTDNTFVRLYSGSAPGSEGCWALTWNAVWDPGSGAQTWSKDNTGLVSSALLVDGESIKWMGRDLGAGSWNTAGWSLARGAVNCSDVNASGPIVGGADITAGDDLIATDKVQAGAGVDLVSGEVVYLSPPSRTIQVPVGDVFPVNGQWTTAEPAVVDSAGALNVGANIDQFGWGVVVPHGATITKIGVYIEATSTNSYSLKLRRKAISSGAPTVSTPLSDTLITSPGVGNYGWLEVSGSVGVAGTDDFWIELDNATAPDRIHSVRVTFTDPGPRNF